VQALHTGRPAPWQPLHRETRNVAGFKDVQRIFMANRGVADFGWWGGPSLSTAHTDADVDTYNELFAEYVTEIN
jgi:hypothetical protein